MHSKLSTRILCMMEALFYLGEEIGPSIMVSIMEHKLDINAGVAGWNATALHGFYRRFPVPGSKCLRIYKGVAHIEYGGCKRLEGLARLRGKVNDLGVGISKKKKKKKKKIADLVVAKFR